MPITASKLRLEAIRVDRAMGNLHSGPGKVSLKPKVRARVVKAKAGLNRSILDQGWSMFAGMLAYELIERGGQLARVTPPYTSQTCAECGVVDAQSRRSQSVFIGMACGH